MMKNRVDTKSLDSLFWRMAVKDDEEALKVIFYEFYPSLCRLAMKYVKCKYTSEDIVQDTFFKIWKNRKKINITTSSRNFLITSIINNCIDYRRKNIFKESIDNDLQDMSLFSPEDVYSVNELTEKIDITLRKMPNDVRYTFELNRFQNKTYREISEELNISQKTVESRISKALKLLRVELQQYLPLIILFLD